MPNKIALCFLTYNNLSKPELWKTFINDNYNIYIHNKYDFEGLFNKYCLGKRLDTKWGHISLVRASIELFKNAYEDEDNKFFILLSDKCVPLYSSNILYNEIFKLNSNIIQECNSITHFRMNSIRDNFIEKDNFSKASQWMILNRESVNFFINNDYTKYFERCFSPDEHYFICLMKKFNISYINKKFTFISWVNDTRDQLYSQRKFKHRRIKNTEIPKIPKEYSNITDTEIEEILKQNTFFLRKVLPDCKLPSYFDSIN